MTPLSLMTMEELLGDEQRAAVGETWTGGARVRGGRQEEDEVLGHPLLHPPRQQEAHLAILARALPRARQGDPCIDRCATIFLSILQHQKNRKI